ncbi:hypothetical protein ACM614_06845, partial [Streptomyces sp. 12297]
MDPYGTGRALLRHAAVFLPAEVPREGRIAFWSPGSEPLPDDVPEALQDGLPEAGRRTLLTVVGPHGAGARSRSVPAV